MHRLPPAVTVYSYRKEHIDDELYAFPHKQRQHNCMYCIETMRRGCMKVRMYFLISAYIFESYRVRCFTNIFCLLFIFY